MKNIAQQIRACQEVRDDSLPTTIPDFFRGRFDDAAGLLLSSQQQTPAIPMAYRYLAFCSAAYGGGSKAQKIVERLRTITLVVVLSVIPYRYPAPLAFPFGSVSGCWRNDMTATRRLTIILAAG